MNLGTWKVIAVNPYPAARYWIVTLGNDGDPTPVQIQVPMKTEPPSVGQVLIMQLMPEG